MAAKSVQDASDFTGVPFLKSVVGGLVVILEHVQVCFVMHVSVVGGCSTECFNDQAVRKNDEELNSLVGRINSVVDYLQDEVKGKSKASRKQVDKVCESFYGYVQSSSPPLGGVWQMTDWRDSDLEKLLKEVADEQKKDKNYVKKFLKSPSIHGHIVRFKQKLEDARSNLTVRTTFYLLVSPCSLDSWGELTL
jgi:hypothetical protein